jgi:hypothetical protein
MVAELRELLARRLPQTSADTFSIGKLQFFVLNGELYAQVEVSLHLDKHGVLSMLSDILDMVREASQKLLADKLNAFVDILLELPAESIENIVAIDIRRQLLGKDQRRSGSTS